MKCTEANLIKIGDRYYYDKFVAFRIETTGFSVNDSRIIEIGAVRSENGKIVDRFSAFVNPGVMISAETEKLTGITNGMLEKAAQIETVLPRFVAFCEDSNLAIHNAATAMEFIRTNCDRQGISCQFGVLDTYVLAHILMKKQQPIYTLEAVADALEISRAGLQKASEAAEATAQILYKLAEMTKNADWEKAVEERQEKARAVSMAGMIDDIRRDAIAKVRSLSEPELESEWQRILETAVELMVCNERTCKEGILVLEDMMQTKYIRDGFFQDISRMFIDGIEPDLIAEAASNRYWTCEPKGIDAMIRYMQIKCVMFMLSCRSTDALYALFLSLIPEKLRPAYDREIGGWKEKIQEKAEEQRMKFDEILKEETEEHED